MVYSKKGLRKFKPVTTNGIKMVEVLKNKHRLTKRLSHLNQKL